MILKAVIERFRKHAYVPMTEKAEFFYCFHVLVSQGDNHEIELFGLSAQTPTQLKYSVTAVAAMQLTSFSEPCF